MTKPLLFITGFLGAGKTTLLRTLLLELSKRGKKADVILNDFANAELDAATLDHSSAASIAPIAASCACCESLDELTALCRAAMEGEGDLLLIELNGTAEPLALLEAFTLMEDRFPFFPRLQVCIVDGRHWGAREEFSALERRQLETAGLWLLSHVDNTDSCRLQAVDEDLRKTAPFSHRASANELVDTLMAELDGHRSSPPLATRPRRKTDPVEIPVRPILDTGHPHHRHHHDFVHQLSHRFTGCQIPLPSEIRGEEIAQLLRDLPDWVLRAKALVQLADMPGWRWLFQRNGQDIAPPIPAPGIRRVPPTLVCVGPRLDPDHLQELVANQFGNGGKAFSGP